MGVFENSVSALQALQRAMNTTSHNISNVNTDGYSRQRAEFATRTPLGTGNGFSGSGVEVETVRRIFDQTRETSVQRNIAEYQRLETLADNAGRIDDLLADDSAGVSPALQDFYGAVQDVASDPSSATAREAMLTQARNVASRFRGVGEQLREFNDDVNTQLKSKVAEVNQLASSIADLNEEISVQRGRFGEPPNDLLDQRDSLIRDLSRLVDTRTVEMGNGALNVYVGTGQALVSGFSNAELTTVRPGGDPTRLGVAITARSGGTTDISRQINGGDIAGLLDYRENVLDPARARLDRMATGVAQTFNAQHRDGLQFSGASAGALGGELFRLGDATMDASGTGASVGNGFVTGSPLNALELTYNSGSNGWEVQDPETGAIRTITDNDQKVAIGGTTLDFGALDSTTAADGDRLVVQPAALEATGMRVAIDQPGQVAAAAALRLQESPGNTGSAAVSDFSVDRITGLGATGPDLTLTYSGSANQFTLTDGAGTTVATIAYNPAQDAQGKSFTLDIPVGGGNHATVSGSISGQPDHGDSFSLQRNADAVGGNANAVALGRVAGQGVFDGGETSLQEYYAGLVGEVGNRTQQAQVARDAQQSVLEQAKAARAEVSGVNLDEEAANLIRFQQAYQAAAQSISIARTTFDALLSATRG